LNNTKCLKVLR